MPASTLRPSPQASPQPKARHFSGLPAWLGLQLALLGCGGQPPTPPDLTTDFDTAQTPAGDGARGMLALRDRGVLRSGYACADCHPVPGGEMLRGAPDLAGLTARSGPFWQGASPTAAGAIARCAARFGATAVTAAFPMGPLLAALAEDRPLAATLGGVPTARSDWDRACAHCHDGGPAPRLQGRPWPAPRFVAAVRQTDRPRHPSSFMPTLASSLVDDSRLAAIATALEAGTLQSPAVTPEVGKPAAQ